MWNTSGLVSAYEADYMRQLNDIHPVSFEKWCRLLFLIALSLIVLYLYVRLSLILSLITWNHINKIFPTFY